MKRNLRSVAPRAMGHTRLIDAAPAGQPERDVQRIFAAPAVQAQLDRQGLVPWIVTEAAFAETNRKETATWAPTIKARKIEAQ